MHKALRLETLTFNLHTEADRVRFIEMRELLMRFPELYQADLFEEALILHADCPYTVCEGCGSVPEPRHARLEP